MTQLDAMDPATVYDCALRWSVPSRSDPHVCYIVELDDYFGNGRCTCTDFQTRFEPLLALRITPQAAVESGQVKSLRPYQRTPADALRCAHIVEARDKFATQVIRALAKAQKLSSHAQT